MRKSLNSWKHVDFIHTSCLNTVALCFNSTLKAWLGRGWAVYREDKRKSRRQFWSWFMMNLLGFAKQPTTHLFVPACSLSLWKLLFGMWLFHSFSSYTVFCLCNVQHVWCGFVFLWSQLFCTKLSGKFLPCGFPSAYLSRAEINLSGRLVQLRPWE